MSEEIQRVMSEEIERARQIAAEQAQDEGLWCVAETAMEAHLQKELRRLTEAVEGKSADECAVAALSSRGDAAGEMLVSMTRWEIGFRNIVTIMAGPRVEFEIEDIVEAVRVLKKAALAHREGEQDAGTRMYEPHTRVLELYYAQKDGCKTHPIGCGKICLECVADELTERESAWRKEREALITAIRGAINIIPGTMGGYVTIGLNILQKALRDAAAPQPIPEGKK